MMLPAAAVERFGRQILVPEIGAHGQAALLRARVAIRGDGGASAIAADLLRRAGVGMAEADEPPNVVLALGMPTELRTLPRPAVLVFVVGDTLSAVVLDRAPCPACVDARLFQHAREANAGVVGHVLAALGAATAVSVLLNQPSRGSWVRFDLETGAVATPPLPPATCGACRSAP